VTPMKKIRIMQVLYTLKGGGGIERLVMNLTEAFNNDQYETRVVGFKGGGLVAELQNNGYYANALGKNQGLDFMFLKNFIGEIRGFNPHIIHAHAFGPNFWSTVLGRLNSQAKIVSTIHTLFQARWRRRPFHRIINTFSDRLVAVSERVKSSYVDQLKVEPSAISVIYNGVEPPSSRLSDLEKMRLKSDLGLIPDLKTIISLGRLEEPKGYPYLLQAARLLAQRGVRANYLVVGHGSMMDELIKMARDMEIEELFHFTGYRPDVWNLMQVADIAVNSSLREGFSVALVELMSMGMPLVVTDVGGNMEALEDGKSCIAAVPADPVSLAEGMSSLLANESRAKLYGAAADSAYKMKFSKRSMVSNYEKLYENIL